MRAMRIAVYIMMIQGLVGLFSGIMVYTDQSWWPGYIAAGSGADNSHLSEFNNTSSLTQDQLQALGVDESVTSTTGMAVKSFGFMSIISSILKSIFYVKPMIDSLVHVTAPDGTNLFGIVTSMIQGFIYIIYMLGLWELITGRVIEL